MDGVELTHSVEVQTVCIMVHVRQQLHFSSAICLDLAMPTNGVISYSADTTPRLEGTVATHSCDVGYELSGGTERTCQSDRTWSGGVITCIGMCLVNSYSSKCRGR